MAEVLLWIDVRRFMAVEAGGSTGRNAGRSMAGSLPVARARGGGVRWRIRWLCGNGEEEKEQGEGLGVGCDHPVATLTRGAGTCT
jgi:hypothetical protein